MIPGPSLQLSNWWTTGRVVFSCFFHSRNPETHVVNPIINHPQISLYIYIHIYILIYVHTSSKTGGLLQALPHVLFPLCVVVGLLGGSTEDFGRVRHASGPSGWLSGCGLFFPQKWMNGTCMGHRCHFLNGHWVNLG